MIAAVCTAVSVLAIAGALRPRPSARRLTPPVVTPQRRRTLPRFRRGVNVPTADEVAAWCERLARVVRGGSTLAAAVSEVEPPESFRATVDDIVLALRRGTRLADTVAMTTASPHLNLAITVIRACAVNGGPPAEPLDRAAVALRGRAADAAERRTQSAQARLSAVVMTVLPLAMLALLLATSSTTRDAALSPAGLTAITIGGAINLVGWRWMQRIVRRVST